MKLNAFDSAYRQIIRVDKSGVLSIGASFVNENKLEGKYVVICKDEDDREKKFLYLTYNINGNGKLLKKTKNGTYSFTNKQITDYYTNKTKSIKFIFKRKISDKNEPYFLFERIEEK